MISIDFQDYFQLTQLYANYAKAVDSGDWDLWPEFFTEDCSYKLMPRENHERGFPLATLMFESKGMLKDRAYGIRETLFHDPYYQRHVVGTPIIHKADGQRFESEANYTVFNTGRYIDVVVKTPDGLKFESRHCIYDSEMIPNSIIYPI